MRDALVCHVTSVHVPYDSRVLYHECRSLATRWRTVLVCRDDDGARIMEGVRIDPLPKVSGRRARVLGVRELVAHAAGLQADLYHFHDPELLPEMTRFAAESGKPVVYDAHEHYPDAMDQKAWIPAPLRPLAAAYADRLERRNAPRLSAVVVADAALKRRFEGMRARRVVELDNYPPLALFRRQAPLDGRPPTLVYVGSVSGHRGFFEMLDVLAAVREEVPDARLLVYGRPTEEIAPRVADAQRRFPEGALEMRGPVSYGLLPEVLAEAHVGLSLLRPHPKYEKNVSMKVFDYMAAGLPYVASRFAPLAEATLGGVGGALVAPGDVAAASSAVTGLLQDAGSLRRAGAEGRALVAERLNWEAMESRLFGLYEELLG